MNQATYFNPIRNKLLAQKYLIGTNIEMREPVAAEIFSQYYDYIWIDWEHTWMDRGHIMDHLTAVRAGGRAAAIVRVPCNDPAVVKPVLDMGADGIVFPLISTVEEARRAIAACTYPPKGVRGHYPIGASRFFSIPNQEYIAQADDRVFKILQIESKAGVENLAEILQLPGVDCIAIGRADLAASVGKIGRVDEEVVELCRRAVEITLRHGVPFMTNAGCDEGDLAFWKACGARMFTVGSDIGMLVDGARAQINTLRAVQLC